MRPRTIERADRHADETPGPCPICDRPNYRPSDHHLVPKSRGGRATTTVCVDCHHAIHAHFTNQELKAHYHTVEALLRDERFRKTVAFLRKQDPGRRRATHRVKDKRRRGRSG